MIKISKREFEAMKEELKRLRSITQHELPSVENQLKMGIEDMKKGKVMRLA